MTNGDFAFFTWAAVRSIRTDQPWSIHITDPDVLRRRQRIFHAVKQVCALSFLITVSLCVQIRECWWKNVHLDVTDFTDINLYCIKGALFCFSFWLCVLQ